MFIKLIGFVPHENIGIRIIFFAVGAVLCSFAVSMLFHTYISPEAYEVFVKEVSGKFGIQLSRFKLAYDCSSCLLAIFMSFIFFGFGKFEGIGVGTVICAFINVPLIGFFGKQLEKKFEFKDKFPFGKYFEI